MKLLKVTEVEIANVQHAKHLLTETTLTIHRQRTSFQYHSYFSKKRMRSAPTTHHGTTRNPYPKAMSYPNAEVAVYGVATYIVLVDCVENLDYALS